jgi:hypothetical protein
VICTVMRQAIHMRKLMIEWWLGRVFQIRSSTDWSLSIADCMLLTIVVVTANVDLWVQVS